MDNLKVENILQEVSNTRNYQMRTEDDFDVYEDFLDYRNILVLMLDDIKVLKKPINNSSSIVLTSFGKEVIDKGGWQAYLDKESIKKDLNAEKDRYDLLSKKWIYKYRYLPYIVSGISLIFSILTYFANLNKQTQIESLKKELQIVKSKNSK